MPASTVPSYVQHAIATLLDRQRDRGEQREFVVLPDGRYRRNVPVDPFEAEPETRRTDAALDALVARLRADVVRANAPSDASNAEAGAPFECDVADAFAFLGFEATHLGGEGEPDVVATAPLGDRTYRVAIECKTTTAQKLHDSAAFVVEAARLRDVVGADYAVLIGAAFPQIRAVDEELTLHRVAMWTVDELCALLAAHAQHPLAWSRLRPLFAPGQQAAGIAAFLAEERFGARKRAAVTLRHVLEAGLDYQLSLVRADPQVERVSAPLTVEGLVVLVNQRLAANGDLGRVGVEDVRAALAFAGHPLVGAVTGDGEAVYVERR